MVAQVCLGKVGAVAAREVSRFARNSRDWQQLIEMCRVVDTVLVDQETVMRLVMATIDFCSASKEVSTSMSLTCWQRSVAARYEKARRGELVVSAPVGFVRQLGEGRSDPQDGQQQAATMGLVGRSWP